MKLVAAVIALGMAAVLPAASTVKPKAKPGTQKSVTNAGSKSGSRGRMRGRRTRAVHGPSYQAHPDPERYQQIQQALTDKGYYKGQVNGQWSDDSSDALKRFQADQKLDSDGKINALTLRSLGLGPKHDGSTAPLSGTPGTGKSTTAAAMPDEPPPIPTEAPAEPPAEPSSPPE
jgi:putative peptidoglycan binding protein